MSSEDGAATWAYQWTPPACPDGTTLDIAYEVFLSVSSISDVELRFVDVLDGRSADRTGNFQTQFFPGPGRGILAGVSPAGRDDSSAYIYSTVASLDFPPYATSMSSEPDTSSISQTYTVRLGPGVER